MTSTRDLLLTEGMRLFGQQGYASTSVGQIEEAAGLSPGSGGLYKHFRSKDELLAAGLDKLLGGGQELADRLVSPDSARLSEQLTAVARAGLRRMDEDRDLSRLLFRGLDAFPELLQRFGEHEIGRFHRAITSMLTELTADREGTVDWAAVAVVLQGATAHYWLLADLFGKHPTGVDEDHFVAAMVVLTAALVANTQRAGVGHTESAEDPPQHSEE